MKTHFLTRLLTAITPLSFFTVCLGQQVGLKVSIIDKAPSENIVARYDGFDKGGNTSIAFDGANQYKWSGPSNYKSEPYGYFKADGKEVAYIKRDRDLGQTFTFHGKSPRKVTSITVSTGYGTNVVRAKMYGKKISIQFFEVSGTATINNNGSDSTIKAFHGFPHNRYRDSIASIRDDYYVGEVFKSLAVMSGGRFPGKSEFGFANDVEDVDPNDKLLKGRLLRFQFPAEKILTLHPGKTYGFLIMIDEVCSDCGFTLANNYQGSYPGGHGIRRDGNGLFPPAPADPQKDFLDPANANALRSAHFPRDFNKRTKITPGTNGYPDVDTWRDLVFMVEAK